MNTRNKLWRAAGGGLLCLGLLLNGQAQAQHQIDLSKQKLTVIDPAFYIKEVVDLRPVPSPIGFVQTGANNKPVPAELAGGLTNGLLTWLPHGVEAAPNARPLIMRVYELNVYEVTGVAEHSFATLDVDFLMPLTDSTYALVLRHIDHQNRGGVDVTNQHDDNIADCLRRALTKLQQVSWGKAGAGMPVVPKRQLAYLDGQPLARYRPPIVMVAYPKRGVYRSFAQFRSNAPEPETGMAIESDGKGFGRLYKLEGEWRQPAQGVWGFSDGKYPYMLVGNQYRQLTPRGPDYTFEGPGQTDVATAIGAGVLFGMMGFLVIPNTTNVKETYVLRTGTGTILPESAMPAKAEPPGDEATIVLYRRGGSKKDSVTVLFQGKPLPMLRPGEYLTLHWYDKKSSVVLKVPNTAGASIALMPIFSGTSYVELLVKQKGAFVTLQAVPAEEGAPHVRAGKAAPSQGKGFFD